MNADKYERHADALRGDIADLTRKLAEKDAQIAADNERGNIWQREAESLRCDITALKRDLQSANERIEALTAENAKLRAELPEVFGQAHELGASQSHNMLMEEIASMARDLSALQRAAREYVEAGDADERAGIGPAKQTVMRRRTARQALMDLLK